MMDLRSIPTYQSSTPWTCTMHTHSRFCDGKESLRDYALAAVSCGLTVLGFSGHAPIPDPPGAGPADISWCMPLENLLPYLKEVKCLKKEFAGTLDIRLGLEVDYIPRILGPSHPEITDLCLDYTIGSVHIAGATADGKQLAVDSHPQVFAHGLKTIFGGSVESAGKAYFGRMQKMIHEDPPDIIGHFDIFKKNNKALGFLDESQSWYRNLVFETLDVIASSRCILEINTGGIPRGFMDEPYPSLFVLKRCRELYIPVMINSDAHHPSMLMAHYDLAENCLKEAGY